MKVSVVRYAYVIALITVFGYAFVTLRGPKGVNALFDKQAQIQKMEKRNADLDKASDGVMRSAFGAQGQKCSANSRVYLDKVYRPVLGRHAEGFYFQLIDGVQERVEKSIGVRFGALVRRVKAGRALARNP